MNERFNGYRHIRDTARRRREATPSERHLWEALRGRRCHGYRFLRQHPIGQYIVDFYCPELHLAVEVDGIHEEPDQWTRDAQREAALSESGIVIVRLTNKDVFDEEIPDLYRRLLIAVGKRVV